MVSHNFNSNESFFLPNKADTPLTIYSYAVLTFPISFKLLKSVPQGNTQALQRDCCIQDFKLDSSCSVDAPEFPDIKIVKQFFRIYAFKRLYDTNTYDALRHSSTNATNAS